jgi:hypothetical protein
MNIANIHTNNLRNDAHFQFFTEFKGLVTSETPEKLKIATQFQAWLPLYGREDEALKKIVKSEFTAKLQEADRARDEIYIGMLDMNRAALRHFSEAVREAAARLKILFDTYGSIDKKPLNEQTSAVYNILQELNGKYAADATAVGISDWVSQLEQRNNAFAALMKERFDETAARTDIVLKEARQAVDKQYKTIIERLNALIIVEGLENYEGFTRTLNAVIAKYLAMLARRGKRGGKGGGEAEETEEAEEPQEA